MATFTPEAAVALASAFLKLNRESKSLQEREDPGVLKLAVTSYALARADYESFESATEDALRRALMPAAWPGPLQVLFVANLN
jgi:folylpolyglutamate synthase/dihydropteroate synthase